MKKKENNEIHKPDGESLITPSLHLCKFFSQMGCQLCVLNPRCACAARIWVLGLSVCLSVAHQTTRRLISGISGFSVTSSLKQMWRYSGNDCIQEISIGEKQVKKLTQPWDGTDCARIPRWHAQYSVHTCKNRRASSVSVSPLAFFSLFSQWVTSLASYVRNIAKRRMRRGVCVSAFPKPNA